jgi:hypothetical protein
MALKIAFLFPVMLDNSIFAIERTSLSTFATSNAILFDNNSRSGLLVDNNSTDRTNKVTIGIITLSASFYETITGKRISQQGDSRNRWTANSIMVKRAK